MHLAALSDAVLETWRCLHISRHYSPCGNSLGCPDNVIHLFSMSKSFGLAGWRVGYAVYPSWASENMVKIQDTLPTHACTASQEVALTALGGTDAAWLIRAIGTVVDEMILPRVMTVD